MLSAQHQVLADGSMVELKPGARIAVEFTADFRRVILQEGEAHFDVRKNAARPFIVVAGGVAARAVGTSFSVELRASAVEVLVTEGEVAVERDVNSPALPVSSIEPLARVTRGNRVVIGLSADADPRPVVTALSDPEVEQKLSWRVPRLELVATPLAAALPRFNRHLAPQRIVLADSALGQIQISGVLRADNADALLRLLELEFGVTSEQHGDQIILRRR
jgi:transmembrane sensor